MDKFLKSKYFSQLTFLTLIIYIFSSLIALTILNDNQLFFKCFKLLRYISYLIFFVIGLLKYYSNFYTKKRIFDKYSLLLFLSFFTILIVTFVSKNTLLMIVFLVVFALYGEDFDRIVSITLKVNLLFFVMMLVLNIFNLVPDIVIYRNNPRYSMGYVYPLELSAHFLFIILQFMYLKRFHLDKFYLFTIFIINLLLYKISGSRTSFIIVCIVIFLAFKKELLDTYLKKIFYIKWIKYIILLGLILFFVSPLCLSFLYAKDINILNVFDQIVSNRLSLASDALQNYDITFLGEKIQWIGFGNLLDPESVISSYNFIDCSYIRFLFDYGYIGYTLIFFGYLIIVLKILNQKNIYLLIIIGIILMTSFMELRLIQLEINPFLLLVSTKISNLALNNSKENEYEKIEIKN